MKLIIVTGASKGFGRAVVQSLLESTLVPSASSEQVHFALFAGTDAAGLEATAQLLPPPLRVGEHEEPAQVSSLTTSLHLLDFCKPLGECEEAILHAIRAELPPHVRPSTVRDLLLVNNAGTLGRLARVQHLNAHDIQTALQCNVTVPLFFTTRWMHAFHQAQRMTIVNISSLAALQPFDCWSLYCTGKAARDMFHKCLAHEHEQSGSTQVFRVLNYAPGPLETQMQADIRSQMPVESSLLNVFTKMHEDKQLVDPLVSARKLVKLLVNDCFENGAHVDFYEI